MTLVARMAAVALAAAGLSMPLHAQSAAGTWEGTVTTQQQGVQGATVKLDSTSTGWTGSLTADMMQGQWVPLSSVTVKGDTISFVLTVQEASVGLRGVIATDTHALNGRVWVDGNDAGTFTLTKKPAAAAAPAKPPRH